MIPDKYLLLPLAIAVPFITGLVLVAGGRRLPEGVARVLAWLGFVVPAAVGIYAWMTYTLPTADNLRGLQLTSNFSTGLDYFGISLRLGLNGLSLPMFVLAGIVGLAAGSYAINSTVDRKNAYLGLVLFMVSGVCGVFASMDLFYFYFFHEFALIPTFILIGWWGGPGGRAAALEMTIYLTLGAMLSLIGLIALYSASDINSFSLQDLQNMANTPTMGAKTQHHIFGLLMFGFGILVSLWPFHTWAPAGYAAAPTPAAMLHAGVLKKFGLYGLLQIAIPLLPLGLEYWSHTLAWLALGNVVIIGAVTIAQRDLKVMLGYSSVMHMGYIFLGLVCVSALGAGGAALLMFAHGLSVAALFLLGDAIFKRTGTYDMGAMGGLCQKAPVLSGFFVAATLAGIGLPGFANFWGEFSVFLALWEYRPLMMVLAATGVVISAIYGLRAVSRIFFGSPTPAFQTLFDGPIADIRAHERWPAMLLLGTLLLVGFWPSSLTRGIDAALPGAYRPSPTSATPPTATVKPAAPVQP